MELSWIAIIFLILLIIVIIALFFNGGTGTTVFNVTHAAKSSNHPLLSKGSPNCFLVNGVEYKFLSLKRGRAYTFNIDIPVDHGFFITQDPQGGPLHLPPLTGTPSPLSGKVTQIITIPNDAPRLLYYQNTSSSFEGCAIQVC